MVICSKLSDAELLNAIYKAASEYSKLIGKSFLIIGKIEIPGTFGLHNIYIQKVKKVST